MGPYSPGWPRPHTESDNGARGPLPSDKVGTQGTTEAAHQLCFLLPVFVQAFGLQLLPGEFIPFLYLQISMELGQLHRRQLQLGDTGRGPVTIGHVMDQRHWPEEADPGEGGRETLGAEQNTESEPLPFKVSHMFPRENL